MDLNLADSALFGNDAGEDEVPEVLASYFVDRPSFGDFYNTNRKLQIVRARKGMGKSALLAKLAFDLRRDDPDAIVLSLAGADLTGMGEFSSEDPAVLVNQWEQVMCSRVNMEIGRRIGWAGSDAAMTMVEGAEVAGFKGRNLVGALLDRIKGKMGPVEVQKLQASNHAQLLRRFAEGNPSSVWLLIDDIDSTFLDTPKMRNKASSFFSACRRMAQSVEGIRIRASVRSDVWPVLRDNEDLDKCEQYMTDIRWTGDELATILSKRILSYIQRTDRRATAARWNVESQRNLLVGLVFPRQLPWGKTSAPPTQILSILAAKRPRWMAQLCRLAGVEAARTAQVRIGLAAINAVMPTFGKLRVSDLYKEHTHQFADIKRLVEAFARGPRRYTTHDLEQRILEHYMSRVGGAHVPPVEGATNASTLQMAHFLFKIGFLQGRSEETGAPIFVEHDDRPTLLTTAVNLDDGMMWEVYPSYRNVLHIV